MAKIRLTDCNIQPEGQKKKNAEQVALTFNSWTYPCIPGKSGGQQDMHILNWYCFTIKKKQE